MKMRGPSPSIIRSRWAAIGAAVAVTLGAGGIGISRAAPSSAPSAAFTAINPCRLADTRTPPDQVGPRATPIGSEESYEISGWGSVGKCNLPTGTAALSLNITALGATLPTFLQVYPGGTTRPEQGSNLNPQPGQPPIPNAVTVALGATGTFEIFNRQGTVNVIVDVVGYYVDQASSPVAVAGVGSNGLGDSLCGDKPEVITINAAGQPVDAAFRYLFFTHSSGTVNADGSIAFIPEPADGLAKVTSVDHPAPGIYCLNFGPGTPPNDYLVSIMDIGLYEPNLG